MENQTVGQVICSVVEGGSSDVDGESVDSDFELPVIPSPIPAFLEVDDE